MRTAKSTIRTNSTTFGELLAVEKYLKENTSSVDEDTFNPLNDIRWKRLDFEGQHDSSAGLIVIGQTDRANIPYFLSASCIISGQETSLLSSSSIYSTHYVLDYKNYDRTVYDETYKNERVGKLISTIKDFCAKYSAQGWDGYDAQPIQRFACDEAIRFVNMLPSDILLPEPLPEPTGAMAFEWYKRTDHVFVVSFSGKGIMEYAGLFGPDNKSFGSERIRNYIPQIVLHHIHRIVGNDLGNCKS
jgi:hypothetical protein